MIDVLFRRDGGRRPEVTDTGSYSDVVFGLVHDVMKMLQRDGNPTQLGEAIAHYGRIFKSLHILTYAVEEPCNHPVISMIRMGSARCVLGQVGVCCQ
jgi:TnpA family transposase